MTYEPKPDPKKRDCLEKWDMYQGLLLIMELMKATLSLCPNCSHMKLIVKEKILKITIHLFFSFSL